MEWLIAVAHWFGSAVCDQLPAHSYAIDGVILPLCARCTGMYLGALATIGFNNWRHPRAAQLPRVPILVALVLFFMAWAGDGVNSFLSAIPVAPHLYPPSNLLRLITGTLMGITVGSFVYVIFNSIVWSEPKPDAVYAARGEFLSLLGIGAAIVLLVQSEWGPLLYPLVLASLAAILVLHGLLMTAMVASVFRRTSAAWRAAVPALGMGLGVALFYLDAIALARFMAVRFLGLPL